jgi:hypothetical protein
MLAGVEGHADPGHTERQEEDASLHGTKPGLRSTRWERLLAVACPEAPVPRQPVRAGA